MRPRVNIADYEGREIRIDSSGRFHAINDGQVAAEAGPLVESKRAIDALFG